MSQTTGIDFRQLARDHDARPFSGTDKPIIVLLPAPEMGGFDVCNCYPSLEKTSTLARRLRRLPLLEAFISTMQSRTRKQWKTWIAMSSWATRCQR